MRRKPSNWLLISALLILLLCVGFASRLIVSRQNDLQSASLYNVAWFASQALFEFTRLEQSISAFGLPGSSIGRDEVELRFDIVAGRARFLNEGSFQGFIQRQPEHRKILDQLTSAISAAEPLIQQIERPGTIQRLLAVLSPLNGQLALLASAANQYGAQLVSEGQAELMRLHVIFSALAGGLALLGLALIAFLGWQNRILEQARADLDRSATAAQEARRRLETTLENMDQGLLMYDAGGVIRVYNRKALELLDLPKELMASQPSFLALREYQLAHGEFERSDERFRHWVAESGFKETPDIYERERPNGTVLEIRTIPFPGGGAVRTFADITGRKQAEIQLRQANETLASLIGASPIGIVSMKPDLTIEIWNPAAEKIFGYAAEEVIGRRYELLVPDLEVQAFQSFFQRLGQGEVLHNNNVQRRRKDGSLVEVNASGAGLFSAAGELRGVVITLEDVTQRKRLEEQLRQAQKMEAVGQLTGGIAHDFNNLLTIILGNAELLTENATSPALVETLSQMILEAAERGADLTQHLLAFGRRQSLKPVRVSLDHVVQGMTPLLQRTIGEHIELRIDLAHSLHFALADRTLLESAILNLVVNARDAMPREGMLTITTGEAVAGPDQAQLPTGQDVVSLTVSDTGIGMSAEVLEHVFEPFYTTKEVGKGSGLGLSMVYGFAQQSGGHVFITSKEGEGTSVTILLPAVNSHNLQGPDRHKKAPAPEGGKERVLLVEDEPQVLQLVAAQLVSLGYEVTAASTGPEALHVLQEDRPFDLLFTDVVLPKGMSGVELAKRARQIRPELKVLLTSGYSEEVFEQHGRPDERTPLLRKPYKRKELAEMLRSVLQPSTA